MAASSGVAGRLRHRLHGEGDAALSRGGRTRLARGAAGRLGRVHGVRLRSGEAGALTAPGPSTSPATDWQKWLVNDQREASGRTDVAVFTSDVLTAPVKISGQPVANLVASTSGTDSDWVVKLIDVYPRRGRRRPADGRLPAHDRRRHLPRPLPREPRERRRRSQSGKPLLYRFALPTANHVFLPGHRIMVQVQSSWFPLYDRNPQTFVPNIFWAKPSDYRAATQRVYHSAGQRQLRRAAARHDAVTRESSLSRNRRSAAFWVRAIARR